MLKLKAGRPPGSTRKGKVTRAITITAETFEKVRMLAQIWQREEYVESTLGAPIAYWTLGNVVEAILADWIQRYEQNYPEIFKQYEALSTTSQEQSPKLR